MTSNYIQHKYYPLNGDNILEKAQKSGRKVAMVTPKDKLRRSLTSGNLANSNGIELSTEYLTDATMSNNGIEYEFIINNLMTNDKEFTKSYFDGTFSIYSGESSINVLKLGVKLIEDKLSDFAYLTTSDYIQHKYGPSQAEALDFYSEIDKQLGLLMDLDCVIGITADHGMNDKTEIIYLQQLLNEEFLEFDDRIKVICPINDPYVVHHGNLGSCMFDIDNDDNFSMEKMKTNNLKKIR